MAKNCPDLVAMSNQELQEFWSKNRPSNLKMSGDRLLAETLPLQPARRAPFLLPPYRLAGLREEAGVSLEQVAAELGITADLLASWELDHMRAPASLSLIYPRLAEFQLP